MPPRTHNKIDIKVENLVSKIFDKADEWLDDISLTGNQTAYSDRILEELFKLVEQLKELHNKELNS